ncbi:MAG: YajD family HNH nuclease [Gammaproteobacteria bacterium]
MPPKRGEPDRERLDRVIAGARRARQDREHAYREQALKLYAWVCGRCGREFDRNNLHELTVHHRDHNHDNNPPDGSNWELLCLYCHDNEHARTVDAAAAGTMPDSRQEAAAATHRPFANLKAMLTEGAEETHGDKSK